MNCSLRDTTECYFLVKSIKTFKYYFPVAILKIEQIQILDKTENWAKLTFFREFKNDKIIQCVMQNALETRLQSVRECVLFNKLQNYS